MSVKISTVAENLASCWHGMVAWSVVLPGTCPAPHTLLSLYLVIPVPVAAPPTWWCVRKQVDFMFKLYSVIRRHFATSLCKYPTATLFFPTRVTRPDDSTQADHHSASKPGSSSTVSTASCQGYPHAPSSNRP